MDNVIQGGGQQLSLEEQVHLLGYHELHETLARRKDADIIDTIQIKNRTS